MNNTVPFWHCSSGSDNRKSTYHNGKWVGLFAIIVALTMLGVIAEAQQTKKVPRLGYVISGIGSSSSPLREAFRDGLRELGYIEGQNLLIEYRYHEGKLDKIPGVVNELVEQNVDILFVTNQVAIRAAKTATRTIPIIMISSVDAVSAERPGAGR